ncbi:uncharacterized protein LOC134445387 [Engraulis encrasicolus]|uniref:uncharacterized protein LOC134445387 n=1 Tax=Engraulis encrasicolus TaxID=184585 RepID=UPI002FD35532
MTSVYTIPVGNTLETHTAFKARLPWGAYKDVSDIETCDVILAFCPVTSRVGTDIEAALREIPEGKPLVLVVLHQTLDSNYTVPDTKRFIKRSDAIAVDCLFNDDGLMQCSRNDKAVKAVTQFLQNHAKYSMIGRLSVVVFIVLLFCVVVKMYKLSEGLQRGREDSLKKDYDANLDSMKKDYDAKYDSLKRNFDELMANMATIKRDIDIKHRLENVVQDNKACLEVAVQNITALDKKFKEIKPFCEKLVQNQTDVLKMLGDKTDRIDRVVSDTKHGLAKMGDKTSALDEVQKKFEINMNNTVIGLENAKKKITALETKAQHEIPPLRKDINEIKRDLEELKLKIPILETDVQDTKSECKKLRQEIEKDKALCNGGWSTIIFTVLLSTFCGMGGCVIYGYLTRQVSPSKSTDSDTTVKEKKDPLDPKSDVSQVRPRSGQTADNSDSPEETASDLTPMLSVRKKGKNNK